MSSVLKVSTVENSCVTSIQHHTKISIYQEYCQTVLAWLKARLSTYIELNLLTPIVPELSNVDYWLGKPLLCLAHCFFPDAFDNEDLVNQFNNTFEYAVGLFSDHLGISLTGNDLEAYFGQIKESMEERATTSEATIRDLSVGYTYGEDNSIDQINEEILLPMMRLYHQCSGLVRQESLTNSSSTVRSPSPRISDIQNTMDDLQFPIHSQLLHQPSQETTWEDIDGHFQQLNQKFQQVLPFIRSQPDYITYLSAIYATRAVLQSQLHKGLRNSTSIELLTHFSNIRNELDFIQAKLFRVITTDTAINDLELRLVKISALIESANSKSEVRDSPQQQQYATIVEQHQLIITWLNDVRYWFYEAERVRVWAGESVLLLESKQIAYDEMKFDYTQEQINNWNREYLAIQREAELFDMSDIRSHVKKMNSKQFMNPAEISTADITYTALMTFDRLTYVLNHHGYKLNMLKLRMTWEQAYHTVMTWIQYETEKINHFIEREARWQPNNKQEKATLFAKLLEFERQLSEREKYSEALYRYRDLNDASHIELPTHIKSRQHSMEESFGELVHRIAFARQVVEQYSAVSDSISSADRLKEEGESLEQEILATEPTHFQELIERATKFQEEAVTLVIQAASRIPYPEDSSIGDELNEAIRMEIGTRKSALVVLSERLDQGIVTLRRTVQSKKRFQELKVDIDRLTVWANERLKFIDKSDINPFAVGKCGLDYDDVLTLRKEMNGQSKKLTGIIQKDLAKLKSSVQSLCHSNSDIAEQANVLNVNTSKLEQLLTMLESSINSHSTKLGILEKRVLWEIQYKKAAQWILNTTLEVWDFITRKAQWRIAATIDEDRNTKYWEHAIKEELKSFLLKTKDFYDSQLHSVSNIHIDLKSCFDCASSDEGYHLKYRQDALTQDYHSLIELIVFAEQVINQHSSLTVFTTEAQSLKIQGEQLVALLENLIGSVMTLDKNTTYPDLLDEVKLFSTCVIQLWEQSGAHISYPQCPLSAYVSRPTTNDDNVSTEIATVVYRTYSALQDLVKKLSRLMYHLDLIMMYRLKIEQWCYESQLFMEVVTSCTNDALAYEFDLINGTIMYNQQKLNLSEGRIRYKELTAQFESHKTTNYLSLKEQLHDLYEIRVSNGYDTVDISMAQQLWEDVDQKWLQLSEALKEFEQELLMCDAKIKWHDALNEQNEYLTQLRNNIQQWSNEKEVWVSKFNSKVNEQGEMDLCALVNQCEDFYQSLSHYIQQTQPGLLEPYNALTYLIKSLGLKEDPGVLESAKQDSVKELKTYLSTTASDHLSEIRNIQKRYKWEIIVDKQLEMYSNYQDEAECFLEVYARWDPTSVGVDKRMLNNFNALSAEYTNKIEALIHDQPLTSTEGVLSRTTGLLAIVENIKPYVEFLNQVVLQHETLCSVMTDFTCMELKADAVRSKLLLSESPLVDELEQYISESLALINMVDTKMTYPVFHYQNQKEILREKNTMYNECVKGIVGYRQAHLMEIQDELQLIMESKQRATKRKAAEKLFLDATIQAELWIVDMFHECETHSLEELHKAERQMKKMRSSIETSSAMSDLNVIAEESIASLQLHQGEDDKDIVAYSVNMVKLKLQNVNNSWEKLSNMILKTQQDVILKLQYNEFTELSIIFQERYEYLKESINNSDLNSITEKMILQWQEQLKNLKNDVLEQMKFKVDVSWENEYLALEAEYKQLETQVQNRITQANNFKLEQDFFSGADSLSRALENINDDFKNLVNESVIIEGNLERDRANMNSLCSSFESICDSLNHQQENYDKQSKLYKEIALKSACDREKADDLQKLLTKQWDNLQFKLSKTYQPYVNSISQWFDLHLKLTDVKESCLDPILSRLNKLYEYDNVVPESLKEDLVSLDRVVRQLIEYRNMAKSQIGNESHIPFFEKKCNSIINTALEAKDILNEKQSVMEKEIKYKSLLTATGTVCEETNVLIQVSRSNCTDIVKSDGDLEALYAIYQKAESQNDSKRSNILNRLEKLDQCIIEFSLGDREKSLIDKLSEARSELEDSVNESVAANEFLQHALEHKKKADEINLWLKDFQSTLEKPIDVVNDVPGLSEKMRSFEEVIQELQDLSQRIIQASSLDRYKAMKSPMNDIINSRVEPSLMNINKQWALARDSLDTLEKTREATLIIQKMQEIQAMVTEAQYQIQNYNNEESASDDDRTRVEDGDRSISVLKSNEANAKTDDKPYDTLYMTKEEPASGSSIQLSEGQASEMQAMLNHVILEMLPVIDDDLLELNTMLHQSKNSLSEAILQQHIEIQQSVKMLKDLTEHKNTMLQKALYVRSFFNLTDSIEALQTSLEESIRKIVSGVKEPLSRTDLQTVLIELDARFKYFDRRISPALLEAHNQLGKLKDEPKLKEHLEEIDRRWELLKKQFKVSKIEISRSIESSADDQQTRFRKSSLPTRKVSTLSRDSEDVKQNVSPTASTASSSSYSSKTATQPSKSATDLKPRNSAPTIVKTPLPNSYVPDPKNDLDVEVSRIVNEIPYKVEVRMAPGGPGRYWFGKINPKLCYCRILKSKMVMVRVGGGWMELTRFLKNHTLLEGDFVPRVPYRNTAMSKSTIPEEENDESVSPTITEGFIETHKAVVVNLSAQGKNQEDRVTSTSPTRQTDNSKSRIAKRIGKEKNM